MSQGLLQLSKLPNLGSLCFSPLFPLQIRNYFSTPQKESFILIFNLSGSWAPPDRRWAAIFLHGWVFLTALAAGRPLMSAGRPHLQWQGVGRPLMRAGRPGFLCNFNLHKKHHSFIKSSTLQHKLRFKIQLSNILTQLLILTSSRLKESKFNKNIL